MATESDNTPTGLAPPSSASMSRFGAIEPVRVELLPKLDVEDYVPSIRPWLRIGTTAVLASAGLGVLFMALCPYRVVVRGPGSVRPAGEQVLVNAPFEGRVVSIDVHTNQSVKVGQSIVTLDRGRLSGEVEEAGKNRRALAEQLQALRAQAEADYARAELEVAKMRSELTFAQTEFDRYQTLKSEGATSASLYEGKRAALDQAKAGLGQAVKGLDAARSQARSREAELMRDIASVDRAAGEGARNLRNTTVRSPVDGIVFQLKVQNPQQTIASGQELATISPSSAERLVKVQIRSEDVDQVQPGQRADLRLIGCPYPDFGTLGARVVTVSPDALPQAGRATEGGTEGAPEASNLYEVTLKPATIEMRSGSRRCEVKLGMQLQADIITRQESLLSFVLRKTRLLLDR